MALRNSLASSTLPAVAREPLELIWTQRPRYPHLITARRVIGGTRII
jgi:hypothetical protein